MLSRVQAGCLVGIEAHAVTVEVYLGKGLPGFDIVGLAETSVRESRVRVRAAISQSGYELAPRHVVLNLAPGDLRKHGTSLDLAIAVALLSANGVCAPTRLGDTLLLGELSLGGELHRVAGALGQVRAARARGISRAIVPAGNARECALVPELDVRCAQTLRDVVEFLEARAELPRAKAVTPDVERHEEDDTEDLADVRGQANARRALEIAAAGAHSVLLVGPPGSGKTMLARRLRSVLPPPTDEEALEIATIASAAGLFGPSKRRPFRAPHHTASHAALMGGGNPVRPGEVTLAHGGVLFLDELPEFQRPTIEALRITMESGEAVIARVRERVVMPARPLVIAAMNPCPCGYAGDTTRVCTCAPERVASYRARVSGPLLDRFDLQVLVPRVPPRALRTASRGEPSSVTRDRVVGARMRAVERARVKGGPCADIGELGAECEAEALRLLEEATTKLGLSARGFTKTLRVARTVADLAAAERVAPQHVAEALQHRALDRSNH